MRIDKTGKRSEISFFNGQGDCQGYKKATNDLSRFEIAKYLNSELYPRI